MKSKVQKKVILTFFGIIFGLAAYAGYSLYFNGILEETGIKSKPEIVFNQIKRMSSEIDLCISLSKNNQRETDLFKTFYENNNKKIMVIEKSIKEDCDELSQVEKEYWLKKIEHLKIVLTKI